jgi:ankyrin repeat protein
MPQNAADFSLDLRALNMEADFDELHRVIKHGDVVALRHSLDAGFDPNTRNPFGWTLLMLAASESNGALCRLLLERGADINAVNQFGGSALASAALAGSHSVVALLLRAGASPHAKPHGHSISDFAHSGGHSNQRVFDLLTEALDAATREV